MTAKGLRGPPRDPMANKPRPRCPKCGEAMIPLYKKRPKGSTYARAGDTFWCEGDDILANGRQKRAKFLDA